MSRSSRDPSRRGSRRLERGWCSVSLRCRTTLVATAVPSRSRWLIAQERVRAVPSCFVAARNSDVRSAILLVAALPVRRPDWLSRPPHAVTPRHAGDPGPNPATSGRPVGRPASPPLVHRFYVFTSQGDQELRRPLDSLHRQDAVALPSTIPRTLDSAATGTGRARIRSALAAAASSLSHHGLLSARLAGARSCAPQLRQGFSARRPPRHRDVPLVDNASSAARRRHPRGCPACLRSLPSHRGGWSCSAGYASPCNRRRRRPPDRHGRRRRSWRRRPRRAALSLPFVTPTSRMRDAAVAVDLVTCPPHHRRSGGPDPRRRRQLTPLKVWYATAFPITEAARGRRDTVYGRTQRNKGQFFALDVKTVARDG